MGRAVLDALRGSHVCEERRGVLLAVHRDWADALDREALLAGRPIPAWAPTIADHGLVGRAAIHVLHTGRGELVAKSASRGGLLGPLLPDRYVDRWRPFREAVLAAALQQRGVHTPTVVVARARRALPGLHELSLATERVPGAVDLLDLLRDEPEGRGRARVARRVGACLRRLHDLGLRHRDLQVKNLLWTPSGEPWVLDLDGSSLGAALTAGEALASVVRFARSLAKRDLLAPRERGGLARATRAFWVGYGARDGARRVDLALEAGRRLERQLRLRGW